jgi:hypothetical protein
MMYLVCLFVSLVVAAKADYAALRKEALPSNTTTKFCGYEDTCSVGGISGVCVSISDGCCGGAVTSGLCPGSSDIRCCTNNPCSTPQGSGSCMQTSACGGTSVAGYCSGPGDIQCCVSGSSGCTLGGSLNNGCDSYQISAGITNQIVNELNSMGYSFRGLNGDRVHCPGFACTLQSSAADSLEAAAASVGDYITLNSAFRSSAEQYILYRWYQRGQCDISLAAAPGSSNHEGGRAIDTSYYSYWNGPLSAYGWVHSYPSSDPVHFDYSGASDISSMNLLAFQRLWNRYNPNSKIDEDGQYGPQTENALANAPCNGW